MLNFIPLPGCWERMTNFVISMRLVWQLRTSRSSSTCMLGYRTASTLQTFPPQRRRSKTESPR